MSIYRIIKENNYTIIDNDYLKDKSLSFGAIGLMTLLLSFKDDTKFNLKLISLVSGKSIKIVTKYLNELKRNNYVNVKRYTTKDGYYYDYFIYESKTLVLILKIIANMTKTKHWKANLLERTSLIITILNKIK